MTEYPYILKCYKCNVEFRSTNTHRQRCPYCIALDEGRKVYPKVFYKNRKIVMIRDGGKCQCCGCTDDGQKTNFLIVHHIDVDTKNNSPSNLITLCTQCHLSLHNKYSKPELRRSNIYNLFAQEKHFGEFGKNLIYGAAKKIVKKQFGGRRKFFFGVKLTSKENKEKVKI
jgi:hypothetical protein